MKLNLIYVLFLVWNLNFSLDPKCQPLHWQACHLWFCFALNEWDVDPILSFFFCLPNQLASFFNPHNASLSERFPLFIYIFQVTLRTTKEKVSSCKSQNYLRALTIIFQHIRSWCIQWKLAFLAMPAENVYFCSWNYRNCPKKSTNLFTKSYANSSSAQAA